MKVHKARLVVGEGPQHYLLSGRIVHMECRDEVDQVEFWFLTDQEEPRERVLEVFGTGQWFEPDLWEYVATTVHRSGLVWHLVERKQ